MGYENVDDEGQPSAALEVAAEGVREFNHRSLGMMSLDRPGWRFVPDAYECLGALRALAERLSQAIEQIDSAVRHELELNLIKIDTGTRFADHPEAAVEAASAALEHGSQAAHQLYRSLADAQNALGSAAYAGAPLPDESA